MTPSLRPDRKTLPRFGWWCSSCHRPMTSILALTLLYFLPLIRLNLRKATLKRSDEMTEISASICGGVGDRIKDSTEEGNKPRSICTVAERKPRKVSSMNV